MRRECELLGLEEEAVLRLALALPLAADGGLRSVSLATSLDPAPDAVSVASIAIEEGEGVASAARGWDLQRLGPGVEPELAQLRRLRVARALPLFSFGPPPRAADGGRKCPLVAVFGGGSDGSKLELSSPSGFYGAAALAGLARNVVAVASAFVRRPEATVGEVVAELPSRRFEVTIAANADHEQLAPVIRHWGEVVGLPVSVRTAQPGEVAGAGEGGQGSQAAGFGATVLITNPDEWKRKSGAQAPRPVREPPAEYDRAVLACGAVVAQWRAAETSLLDEEIFVRRSYLRHGLQVPDGAVVVDVGANIGLFALFAHLEARDVKVHAVEPVAELAALARANAEVYGIEATIHEVALGDREGTAELSFYPDDSLQSGLYADRVADAEVRQHHVSNQARAAFPSPALRGDGAPAEWDFGLLDLGLRPERRAVPQRRLSDLIRESGLNRIDLLKIDAERGEEDVLDGIDAEHWSRITQLVVEVHDVDDRLDRLARSLVEKGFLVNVEQQENFSGTEVFMLYASRGSTVEEEPPEGLAATVAAVRAWAEVSPVPVYTTVLPSPSGSSSTTAMEAFAASVATAPGARVIDLSGAVHLQEGRCSAGEGAAAVGTEIMRRITAPLRPPLKAVAVDADNTLWDGVCGEVGADGVAVELRHLALQKLLLQQKEWGRLLCLCSRNDPGDVEEVFARHPEMPLGLRDFAAKRVNWEAKASSLLAIADDLGVQPESIVFIDDDPAQREEIRLRVPEVTVVDLPDDPARHLEALADTWMLDPPLGLTREDRLRASFTEANRERARVAGEAKSFVEYLRELDLDVEISEAVEADLPRLAQLAQRTNQFNLTLRRHGEGELRHLLADSAVALTARVGDRFGDYGLVGFIAADDRGRVLEVTDFMLSCRALGRNVEWAMLNAVAARSDLPLLLTAIRGQRNTPARAFLAAVGERCGGELDGDSCRLNASRLVDLDWRTIAPRLPAGTEAGAPRPTRRARWRWPAPAEHSPAELARIVHHASGPIRSAAAFSPPSSRSEQRVAAAWGAVLGIPEIGVHDDFFMLGGDSLAALAVCDLLWRHGEGVSLEALMEDPTVAGIAARLDLAETLEAPPRPADDSACEEASDGQRRVWAAELTSGKGSQVIPLSYEVAGELDVDRLESALIAVVASHQALHSALVLEEDRLIRQRLDREIRIERVDLAALETEAREAEVEERRRKLFRAPFRLDRELPLRALCLRLEPERHLFLLALHHSACDGWSVGVLQRDLSSFFAGAEDRPDLPGFGDYVRWVAGREQAGGYQGGLEVLSRALPPPDRAPQIRADLPRRGRAAEPACLRLELPVALQHEVRSEARYRGSTPFGVYLAGFGLVLAARSDRSAAWVGCPVANRGGPGHQQTVGYLANIVPLALSFDWSWSAGQYLDACAEVARISLRHGDVPYGLLLRHRLEDPYRFDPPPFEAMFTLQTPPSHPLRLLGCRAAAVDPVEWPLPFELMLDLEETSDGVSALLRFDRALFSRSTAAAMLDGWEVAVEALIGLEQLPLETVRGMLGGLAGEAARGEMEAAADRRRSRLRSLSGAYEGEA